MSRENVEIVRELFEHWERGDFVTPEFFHADVEYVRVGVDFTGGAGEWRGLDEVWSATADWLEAFTDLRNEAERLVDLGDRVLVLWRQTGRGRRSGVPYERDLGDIITLREGKVARLVSYWDRAEALEAAGLRE